MAEITAGAVKALREKTGAGMMECKKALTESAGDEEKAIKYLRERGIATAEKRAGKVAAEGSVGSYIHMGGKIGVLVEVNCETDFVARGDDFQNLVKDIAMHIAALAPEYVAKEDVPADVIEREREIEVTRLKNDPKMANKPADILNKIAEGRLAKFYEEACLLEQPFAKDQAIKVGDLVTSLTGKIGEKITIRRFTRYKLGEGIEKKQSDFAAEVAEALKKE
jgi:elongation factor Ts